jgi:hypothetical protein
MLALSPTPNLGGGMRYLTVIFCGLLVLFVFQQTQAKIIQVPADSSTIQTGIDGAVNGDTVLVASGTYYEHLNFGGKAILLISEAGAESTVISKLDDGLPMVTFDSGEDSSSVLDGFTIQNANNDALGGAIYCYDGSSPTIRNNILKDNVASFGGGVCCKINCSPIIKNNRIVGNSTTYHGAGVYCGNSSSPEIINNQFIQNTADQDGSSIACEDNCLLTIHNNLMIENSGNSVISLVWESSGEILNNTLDSNTSDSASIYSSEPPPDITNTIVSNELMGYGIYSQRGLPSIAYCDVFNNAAGDYHGCFPGVGCISADPVFCDFEDDDYYLHANSPCLGSGQDGADIGAFGIGCGSVLLLPGPDQAGPATSEVSVFFHVQNEQHFADTLDVDISDSLAWTIVPTYYEVPLEAFEVDTVNFVVSIADVPVGTVNKLRGAAVSQTDPSVADTAYLWVTCNAPPAVVEVTAGSDESGYADSMVTVSFLVENVGVLPDSYNLDISDTQAWDIVPLHYDLDLDTAESEPVNFTVSIPYVPLGTIDEVTLLAVSKTDPLVRDSATLTVTCNAYVEDWEMTSGGDITAPSNSLVSAKFYVQNTGLAQDSCSLIVSDSLGWDIQPPDYQLTLDPGQQDSVFFEVSIPGVPLGITDKITLNGASLTNPFVFDSASLLLTCDSYNITITEISDVGNDQGKQARVYWSSFPGSDPLVTHFTVYRRADSLIFASLGIKPRAFSSKDYPPGDWDMVGTYPAYGDTAYLAVVPTLKDSTIAEGMHWSVFFIRAGTDNPTVYFDSPIDSGYSLDNLSPSPPTGLLASHEPAVTKLTWAKCTDLDFDYYTLYRDTTSEFEPSPDNKLAFEIDTAFVDSTAELGRPYYYLASATDFSGNESDPSNEVMGIRYIAGDADTDGTIDVGDIVFLVNYIFLGAYGPDPLGAGDADCNGEVDIGDVVYLVNYLLLGGMPPSC